MQYWNSRFSILAKIHSAILIKNYGININPNAEIGCGLWIPHPTSICMTNVKIGKNFTIMQNCTIGVKKLGLTDRKDTPKIGDNCTVCANSLIIGNVNVVDNCTIGACSLLLSDANVEGVYVGNPAKLIK